MQTQAPYTAEKKVTIKKTIYPPQEIEKEIQLPFYSRSKSGTNYFKVITENRAIQVWTHGKSSSIAIWEVSGSTVGSALEGEECTEQEFTEAYNKAKQIIESNI